jgi:hypothetical protein
MSAEETPKIFLCYRRADSAGDTRRLPPVMPSNETQPDVIGTKEQER